MMNSRDSGFSNPYNTFMGKLKESVSRAFFLLAFSMTKRESDLWPERAEIGNYKTHSGLEQRFRRDQERGKNWIKTYFV